MNPLHKLNQIYISEHLYPIMNSIKDYALTSVIAPMGYGKSTAVNSTPSRRLWVWADYRAIRYILNRPTEAKCTGR